MSSRRLQVCFIACPEGGGHGGVDVGVLSTTTKMEVAVSYIGDKAIPVSSLMLAILTARLSFLLHPNEDQVLIPPLSRLEVVGEPFWGDELFC